MFRVVFRKLIAFLLLLTFIYKQVTATQCYACSTFMTAWCRDPFDKLSPVQPVNCSDTHGPQKQNHTSVLENLFMVMGTGWDAEIGVGVNDMRRRRFAMDMLERIKREEAKETQALEDPKPLQDPGYQCFKISYTSLRNTLEVFRGCRKTEHYDLCDILLKYSEKAKKNVHYCDVCENPQADYPNPDDSPPCNRADRAICQWFVVLLGVARSILAPSAGGLWY